MSLVEFKMDLGDAGEFDFIIEYRYYPANKAVYPGEKNEPEWLAIDQITYGGLDWTKQLGPLLQNDEKFLAACRAEWQDEVAEHQLRLVGC